MTGHLPALVYIGLGFIGIGLLFTFITLGEKDYSTLLMKLLGPLLVGSGVIITLLKILLCKSSTISFKKTDGRNENTEN